MTSANLTQAAMVRNHEFGCLADDAGIIEKCRAYFDGLWNRAGDDLESDRLKSFKQRVDEYQVRPAGNSRLGDEGADTGFQHEPLQLSEPFAECEQAFVKFFGEGNDRADRSTPIIEEVKRSGSHWACTYPKGKRPRQVCDGAVMFMGRLVKDPDDIMIYGRAIGMHHVEGRDDATREDIERRGCAAIGNAGDKRKEYFQNRVLKYYQDVWPKDLAVRTESVSIAFAELCLAAGDLFPQALKEFSNWLQKLDSIDLLIYRLGETDLCKLFPSEALQFLDAIVSDRPNFSPIDLKKCLEKIVDADSSLGTDTRYRRLLEITE